MGFLDRVRKLLDGGDTDLGREDLLRQIEEGILALRRHGAAGREVFPPAVRVRVQAAEGSLETLRQWTSDPRFEQELEARLLNRLVEAEGLPTRQYRVERGETTSVRIEEESRAIIGLAVLEGGDRDGACVTLESGRREWRLGRGAWHQERAEDQRLPNDIVLSDNLMFISRAAAILHRSGATLEVEARQQGEFLVVLHRDGSRRRPSNTARGRVAIRVGDRLEFHDGGQQKLVLAILPEGEE